MRWSTCALCPRLCRSSCPVATGSGREAATPSVIGGAVFEFERGRLTEEQALHHATLCTDCGGCQDHCHLDVPLPEALREFRAVHTPAPPTEPLNRIEGRARLVAIESDERPFASALSTRLGTPVAKLRTADHLGVAAIEHASFDAHAQQVSTLLQERDVVIVSGGVAEVLDRAGVKYQWLRAKLRDLPSGRASCRQGAHGCCGGAGPLARFHPEDAARVGKLWLRRHDDWVVEDSRCRAHLRSCGGEVTDALDALLDLS